MIFIRLYWEFFKTGLFAVGGGMATLPFLQDIGESTGWYTYADLMNMLAVSESTPGPIGINSATFVGTKIAGLPGAIVATLGCILPSCIIVLTLAYFYFKYRNLSAIQGVLGGLRPAVVALIASAGISMVTLAFLGNGGSWLAIHWSEVNWLGVALFGASLLALRKWKPNPILVMAGCGVVGLIAYSFI